MSTPGGTGPLEKNKEPEGNRKYQQVQVKLSVVLASVPRGNQITASSGHNKLMRLATSTVMMAMLAAGITSGLMYGSRNVSKRTNNLLFTRFFSSPKLLGI